MNLDAVMRTELRLLVTGLFMTVYLSNFRPLGPSLWFVFDRLCDGSTVFKDSLSSKFYCHHPVHRKILNGGTKNRKKCDAYHPKADASKSASLRLTACKSRRVPLSVTIARWFPSGEKLTRRTRSSNLKLPTSR